MGLQLERRFKAESYSAQSTERFNKFVGRDESASGGYLGPSQIRHFV